MADNNLGSSEEINGLNNSFENFTTQLSSSDKGLSIVDQSRKKSIESLKKQNAAQKELINAATSTITSFYSFGKSLSGTKGEGGFESLNKIIGSTAKLMGGIASAIPVVGGAFQGVIEGAAETAKFLTGQFSKAYGNFEKLADSGVISTFEGLQEVSSSTGLTFTDTEKVLSKYSKELSNFGGSALTGTKRFQDIAFESKKLGESFQVIGISASDFADMQLSYIAQQQRTSAGKNLTDKQIIEGSVEYVEKLDTLSKLTGFSRKELQEQMMDRTRNVRYMASTANLNPKIKENIDGLLSKLTAVDVEFGEGMMDAISSDARSNTDKEKKALYALRAGGMDVNSEIEKLKKGGSPKEFQAKVAAALKRYAEDHTEIVRFIDQDNIVSGAYIASQNIQFKSEAELQEIEDNINKSRKKDIEATDTEGKKLAATNRSMYNTTRNIELLATGSKTMAAVMNKMSGGIETVIEKLYGLVGDKGIPEFLKLRKEERIAINSKSDTQKELNKNLKRQAELEQEQANIAKDPNNPTNKKLKQANARALETLKIQIEYNKKVIEEQDEKIATISEQRKKADIAAGFGPTIGSSATSSTSGMPAGAPSTTVTQNKQLLLQSMNDLGVMDPRTRAAMAATAEGESGFQMRTEIDYSNTSNDQIRKSFGMGSVFGKMSDEQLTKIKSDPKQFFDLVYGGRYGNAADEGYKYRGRGFIGLTFKGNYEKYGKLLGIDLVGNPDLANDPIIASKIAVLMMREGMAKNANADIFTQVARSIGNPNEVTEGKKAAAYQRNLQSGEYAPDKKADLSFINKQPPPESVAQSQTLPKGRTGGIMSGPSTGYLAILHGDEMVIPANPGSSELQFTGGEQTQSDNLIQGILLMMTKKVDKMISVTKAELSNQRKLAVNNVT